MNTEQNFNSALHPAIAAMQCYAQPSIQLFNCDNRILMQTLADESVDVILTDPPYLYLKNQKLERPFDEQLFFSECKRLLTKNGFIVLFGRGTSFYRWNTILDDLGFNFKEEIIWDKKRHSSPVSPISRRHETISIHSKGKGVVNLTRVDYFEANQFKPDKVIETINRIKTTFGNRKTFDLLMLYFTDKKKLYNEYYGSSKFNVSIQKRTSQNRTIHFVENLEEGYKESSIIDSIIEVSRDHYNTIHPTQKPVRLLERLLALVIPKDKEPKEIVVADFFGGSFSTMEAVYNMGMQGIACEIDKEYFEAGKKRIESLPPRQAVLFE